MRRQKIVAGAPLKVYDIDIAASLGINRSTLSRWRRGLTKPSPLAIVIIKEKFPELWEELTK